MRIEKADIELQGITLHAYHGVLPEERISGAEYTVDLKCQLREPDTLIGRIAETDDISDTVNYAELYKIIEEEMAIPSDLLETVATRIGKRILNEQTRLESLSIRIEKLNPPIYGNCPSAAVTIKISNAL